MNNTLEIAKGRQACEILEELNLDCWLIWVRETAEMADPALKLVFPGSLVWASALLFTREGERIAIVGRFDARGIPDGLFDRLVPYDKGIRSILHDELGRIDPRTIAIDISQSNLVADGLTVGMHQTLLDHLAGTPYETSLVSAEGLIGRLRARKLPEEIDHISRAVELTEHIFAQVLATLAIGQTEQQVQTLFQRCVEEIGAGFAWDRGHNPAVDAGPDKVFGHLGPTDRRTKAGELL
ncbi:aminopeptidase P family protein, partial [Candidatus Bipolaricaulota bacterium]